jgi:gamma-glutamyltranspeptidase/glutathione hydrolase
MNNGVMWFDPCQGRPNSIGPNKRPLTNMCPLIVRRGANPWFALGASGGRKIFPAVLQIASFLVDHRLSLEEAFHQPRIDASGRDSVGVDPRLAPRILEVLSRRYPVNATELLVFPTNFACPSAVLVDAETGERHGASDLMSPWSSAVAERE